MRISAAAAETGEDDMEDDQGLDFRDQSGLIIGAEDARVIADYSVGAAGVGPMVGFGSDDFFPSAPPPNAVPDSPPVGGVGAGR